MEFLTEHYQICQNYLALTQFHVNNFFVFLFKMIKSKSLFYIMKSISLVINYLEQDKSTFDRSSNSIIMIP
jgi:hypothetical protein